MKYLSKILLTGLVLFSTVAFADGYDLAVRNSKNFPVTTTAPTTGDQKLIYVATDNKWELYTATAEKLSGSFDGTVGATTPSTGVFTTLTSTTSNGTTYNAGASGTAGTLNVFPTTAAKGKLILSAVDNTGAFNSTLRNADIGQATVYSLPDPGAATANLLTDAGAQTITGVKTFGGAGAVGKLKVAGTTSGSTILDATAVAGSGTVTLPTTGTLATLAGSEVLSGKTLTSPIINGPAPVACGSTCTLGTANVGTYTRLDTAGGSAATLPTATGTGTTYKLYISVANSSNQDKVLLATVTDTIIGTAQGENAGTAKVFVGNAGTYHSIQMPFAGTQPSGGFVGDSITCTDVASTIWKCDIMYQAGTTPTTPYSTSTT